MLFWDEQLSSFVLLERCDVNTGGLWDKDLILTVRDVL